MCTHKSPSKCANIYICQLFSSTLRPSRRMSGFFSQETDRRHFRTALSDIVSHKDQDLQNKPLPSIEFG